MIDQIEAEIIGSAFYALPLGETAKISFDSANIKITCEPNIDEEVHLAELIDFNIYGPGKIVTGGGFVGGGSGTEGALLGVATSAILNAATTKATIQTLISLITIRGEIHFLCKSHEPYALRIGLSRIYSVMRHYDTTKVRDHFLNIDLLAQNKYISQSRVDVIKAKFANRDNFLPMHGYIVNSVSHGFAAHKAGIKIDDLLVKYNATEIKTDDDLSNAIRSSKNPTNKLLIIRNGRLITLNCDSGRLGIDGKII